MLEVPILFLVFNRPELTKQVFDAIRQVRPSQLYVAADGPRDGEPGDIHKCDQVRQIATQVNWNCEVKTLFRDHNLGCGIAVSSAIDWFFKHEPEGIILEDDCLPHKGFFTYCEWALEAYREDKKVWHINGNNFEAPGELFADSTISYSALAQVWGWATWRDRWAKCQSNPFYLMQESKQKVRKWLLSPMAKISKIQHIVHLQNGLNTWDYQWQCTVLNNSGLCVTCSSNLISNIGGGEDATHTPRDARTHLDTSCIHGELTYTDPILNKQLTSWYETKMGLSSIRSYTKTSVYVAIRKLKLFMKDMIASLLFVGIEPIVVGSTGRSGSTVLCKAISESLVFHRFKVKSSSLLGRVLGKFALTYIDRVSDVNSSWQPVNKTHGLLPVQIPAKVKFVFVYGDPLESALSVQNMMEFHGRIWFEKHLYHLESQGSYNDLFNKDILNYERLIDSWVNNSSASILCLRYDYLWDRVEDIKDFLGIEIYLPERKKRSQKKANNRINTQLFNYLESLTSP